MIVELEKGVWLADGYGDPPKTLLRGNAKRFDSMIEAVKALCDARVYRPFKNAEISEDYSDHDKTL